MKKVIFASMLCMAIFTACSEKNSSDFSEKEQVQTTTAVTSATTAATTTSTAATTTTAVTTTTPVAAATTAVTTTSAVAATTIASTKEFHAEHSITFTPNDLDHIQLKDDYKIGEEQKSSYREMRDAYLSQLLENGNEIPVYVGDIAVDHQNNCVYVIGIYDWCTMEEPYFGDVAVFRIDEATGDITQCCRKDLSSLGRKNGFGLFNVRGKTFMDTTKGLYLVDEENNEFVTLEPDFNPQVSSLYISDERVIVQVPVMNEDNSTFDLHTAEYDFESNTMKEISLNNDDTKNMRYYNEYDMENIYIEYEYAIPENRYSKTKITVEW